MHQDMEKINVCIPIKNYVREAGVMLCSLFENTTRAVDVYILFDDLQEKSKEQLKTIADRYNQNISFIKMQIDREEIKQIADNNKLGYDSGVLYRLKIADVLPANIEKAILIGTDLIFNIDIGELWSVDTSRYSIMGVQDESADRGMEKYLQRFESYFEKDYYVNSDVILMNMERVRQKYHLWEQCINFLCEHPDIEYMDQDALNYVFRGDIGLLDEKFNMLTIYKPKVQRGIYHFAGDHILYKRDFARQKFFHYLAKTPWAEDGYGILMRWLQDYESRMNYLKLIIQSTTNKVKCFWGIGAYFDELIGYFSLNNDDFFVDTDPNKWGGYTKSTLKKFLAQRC